MKIALCQMRMSEDAEQNCQKALEQIAQAAKSGARLIAYKKDGVRHHFLDEYHVK